MTKRLRVHTGIGRQTAKGANQYPSAPGYTAAMRRSAKEMTDAILSIFDQFEDASEDVMLDALRPTFELSKVYCPVDSGDLLASGYLEKTGFRGKPRVEIGYAKAGYPDYGTYVHEMIDIPHESPTRSKWLQAAVMEDLPNVFDRLAVGYKRFSGL